MDEDFDEVGSVGTQDLGAEFGLGQMVNYFADVFQENISLGHLDHEVEDLQALGVLQDDLGHFLGYQAEGLQG